MTTAVRVSGTDSSSMDNRMPRGERYPLPRENTVDHLVELARCLPFRSIRNDGATGSLRLRWRTARFDVTGYGKRNVPLGHGMRANSLDTAYSLLEKRDCIIEICSRVADDADDPLPPVTRMTKLVPIETGSELVSRFKGVIVSYCKVSIDSSQLRCTVFSKYLG